MDIQFPYIILPFPEGLSTPAETYGEIQAEMVHPSTQPCCRIIHFSYRGKGVWARFSSRNPISHPIGKIAEPAGGQRTGRGLLVYRISFRIFPVIVSQHFSSRIAYRPHG